MRIWIDTGSKTVNPSLSHIFRSQDLTSYGINTAAASFRIQSYFWLGAVQAVCEEYLMRREWILFLENSYDKIAKVCILSSCSTCLCATHQGWGVSWRKTMTLTGALGNEVNQGRCWKLFCLIHKTRVAGSDVSVQAQWLSSSMPSVASCLDFLLAWSWCKWIRRGIESGRPINMVKISKARWKVPAVSFKMLLTIVLHVDIWLMMSWM